MDGKEGKRMNKKKQAGQAFLLAAALVLPATSMIKIFILAKAYEDIQSGSLRRNETFTLTPDNVVGGAGILQGRGDGTRVSLQEALNLMITESDNTAANLLIDRLGMDRINSYMQSHGYTHGVLRRKMMDTEAMREGRENLTSTRDVALLFKRLYRGNGKSCRAPGFA